MEELKEFAQHVKDMRDAQKKYFATRNPQWITLSKERERQVDKLTEEILSPQKSLFN